MKLLIVTQIVDRTDPALGFFHRWIEAFSKECDSVEVICLREGEHTLPDNVRVHSLGKKGVYGPTGVLAKIVQRIRYSLRFMGLSWRLRNTYDAVFVHMNPEYILLSGLQWHLLKKPVGLWYLHKSTPWYLRRALPLTSVVFSASRESFRLPTDKLEIVGHGIDVARYAHIHRHRGEGLKLLTISRISASKRIDRMIAVADTLAREGRQVTLTVVGAPATQKDAAYLERVQKEATKHKTFKSIFAGSVPHEHVPEFLEDASIFLNFSTTGSVDKAVLEALAAGIPVVTTNEAFADMGPVIYVSDREEEILKGIKHAKAIPSETLRAYVRERYDLTALISRIVQTLGDV